MVTSQKIYVQKERGSQEMDAVEKLAQHVAGTRYEDLPPEVVKVTKDFIFDTLGCALAGSSAPGCQEVAALVQEWGGKEEAGIFVYGGRVPAVNAVLVNAMLSHARDLDDTHDRAHLHANCSAVPAAFGAAELKSAVTGKELITAVALGVDLTCRLGLACPTPLRWIRTATCGAFGATVAAGKIFGFNSEMMHRALGVVYSQVAGNCQALVDGGLTKRMQPALSARAGLFSAILAERGVTGAVNVLEGKYGFFPLYENGQYLPEQLTAELGKRFEGVNLSVKPYPCCRATQASIDAAVALVAKEEVNPQEIEKVTMWVPQYCFDLVGRPFEIRQSPQVDAQFSIPYTVATVLVRKSIFLEDFEEERIRDPRVLELARRVEVLVDRKLPEFATSPVTMEVKLKAGKTYTQRIEIIKGHPQNPLSQAEFLEKFQRCTQHAVLPFSLERIKVLQETVLNLETVPDVRVIPELLVPSGAVVL